MSRSLKEVNVEIGARIKQIRKSLKLTRGELALRSGYSANFIQEVELGRSGLSSESIEANHCDFIARKLAAVPKEKQQHILKILDEAIECAK